MHQLRCINDIYAESIVPTRSAMERVCLRRVRKHSKISNIGFGIVVHLAR